MDDPINYVALNCTLKRGDVASSTALILDHVTAMLSEHGAVGQTLRVVDHGVSFGVTADEGEGDGWPTIRDAIMRAEILILGTPIWLGHPSSVCQMVLERLDAFLGETDERNQIVLVDKVAMVAVVGNEDGAHHVGAEVFQALNDVGFALAPGAMTYWVGEAMQKVDFRDLDEPPAATMSTARTMVANSIHLVELLRARPFPSRDA